MSSAKVDRTKKKEKKNGHQPVSMREIALFRIKKGKNFQTRSLRSLARMSLAKVDRQKKNGYQPVSSREMALFGLKNAKKKFKLAHSVRSLNVISKSGSQKKKEKKNGHQPVSMREIALFR